MLKEKKLFFMCLIPFSDILFEYTYQIFLLFSLRRNLTRYPKFLKRILNDHMLKHIKESIMHNIHHLSIHAFLILTSLVLVSITLNQKIRSRMFTLFSPIIYFFPKFLGVSEFEILLLELQYGIARCLESKFIWDLFVDETPFFNLLWPVFVFLILIPLEIRFKIFLEHKFHHMAGIIVSLLHATATVLFPIIYFAFVCMFYDCRKLGIPVSSYLAGTTNTSLYYLNTHSTHVKIMPIPGIRHNCFLVIGNFSHHVNSSLLFESCNFDGYNLILYIINLFIRNLLFAGIMILFDKKYLKMFCNNEVHHISAHLLTEELFDVGFSRYFLVLNTLFENMISYQYDEKLRSMKLSDKVLSDYFESQLHNHKNILPSKLRSLFNPERNFLERIERLLSNN
ncbi:hypothetical protein GINT2_001027 [Glugoides intestinalis]